MGSVLGGCQFPEWHVWGVKRGMNMSRFSHRVLERIDKRGQTDWSGLETVWANNCFVEAQ